MVRIFAVLGIWMVLPFCSALLLVLFLFVLGSMPMFSFNHDHPAISPRGTSALRATSRHKRRRRRSKRRLGGAATDGLALRACDSTRCLPCWTPSAAVLDFRA
ncbi:hypothetical protein BJ912DRAFT_620323 [Pholiota molesta]|nr:hypothetical protein BJ912DRAFT_620323 [Pholiota molesta]